MAGPKTRIRAPYIIAFEGGEHRYLRDGELVFQGGDVVYVGKGYAGETDRTGSRAGVDAERGCPGCAAKLGPPRRPPRGGVVAE